MTQPFPQQQAIFNFLDPGEISVPSPELAFPMAQVVKNLPAMQETQKTGLLPGKGNGKPLQYSCLENPIDRGAWWATVSEKLQRV